MHPENYSSFVTAKTAREILKVSDETLRRWADQSQIKTVRTPGNHRLYDVKGYLAEKQADANQAEVDTPINGYYNFSDSSMAEFIGLSTQYNDSFGIDKIAYTNTFDPLSAHDNYLQISSVFMLKPTVIKQIHQPFTIDYFVPLNFCDAIKNFSLLGPIADLTKIEICILTKKETKEKSSILFLPQELELTSKVSKTPKFSSIYDVETGQFSYEVVETLDQATLDIHKTLFGWSKSFTLPTFLTRCKSLILSGSLYSRIFVRLCVNPHSKNTSILSCFDEKGTFIPSLAIDISDYRQDIFSLGVQSYYLSNPIRAVVAKQPFAKAVECFSFLTSQPLDKTDVNKVMLPKCRNTPDFDEWKMYAITALFVSVYNKTQKRFEVSSIESCSLVFDGFVYRSYTRENFNLLLHTQQLICPESNVSSGQPQPHFIFPFASELLKTNVDLPFMGSGHINLCNISDACFYIEFHDKTISCSSDEYEVFVNCTKIQKLSFKEGKIDVKVGPKSQDGLALTSLKPQNTDLGYSRSISVSIPRK